MTEDVLKEIEEDVAFVRRFGSDAMQTATDLVMAHGPSLVAEVRRLQALVKKAEWEGDAGDSGVDETCPWCHGPKPTPGFTHGHTPDCPAFGVAHA